MASNDQAGDVATYAASVRAALSDLPPDQADVLLEDLEDHLREIATDAGGSLAERLGPPDQYARELRAAYGVAHAGATRQHPLLRDVTVAISRVTTSSWYRQGRAFLPELRQAWWVLGAYLAVFLVMAAINPGYRLGPVPNPVTHGGFLAMLPTGVATRLHGRDRRQCAH